MIQSSLDRVTGTATSSTSGSPLANQVLLVREIPASGRGIGELVRVYGSADPHSLLSAVGEVRTDASGNYTFYAQSNLTLEVLGYDAGRSLVFRSQNSQPGDTGAVNLATINAALATKATQGLSPTGNDDSALLSQYVQDMASSGHEAVMNSGDFIIGTPMTWRSRKTLGKWGAKGIGLTVKGAGPGNTRLLWAAAPLNTSNMLSITAPASANIGQRNYLTDISGMSIVRAPGGTEIAAGSTDGFGIYGGPSAASGEVLHTPRFKSIFFDGFSYPVTLSDCTLAEFDTVWWLEFLVGLRLGYNADLLKIRHSMFGCEQFGTSYRNSAIAVQNGFSDGFNTLGAENIVEFDHVWFMKIGKGFEAITTNVQGLRFRNSYFEDTKQYVHHKDNAAGYTVLSFEKCHFSHPSTNDTTQHDPTLANYMAKIQADGDVATGVGKNLQLSMRDNTADITAPGNAWVSFVNVDSNISWENNPMMAPSATYGHIRCARTSKPAQRTFPQSSGLYGGSWVLGDKANASLSYVSGTPVEVSATIGAAATYLVSYFNATHYYLTLPDGDCTINIDSTSPYFGSGATKLKVILIVPATVTATRTVNIGSRITGAGTTVTFTTTDTAKRATLMLEGTGKGDASMRCVSGAPTFI